MIEPSDRKEVQLTQSEAELLCREWQEILRLQNWDVVVRVARGNGLNLPPEVQARCNWTLSKRSALIRLMNPIDYDPDCITPQDMEQSLVHELLHLHCAPFDEFKEDTAECTALEQAIDALAKALVALKRRDR